MRLDKYISQATELSRKEAKKVLHRSEISVNGKIIKDGSHHVDVDNDMVEWAAEVLAVATKKRYILLYKPDGFECSLKPKHHPSVVELIAIPQVDKLRMAGRLDVDTTGLLLLSDDGGWLHRVTSPKRACKKIYEAVLARPMDANEQHAAITKVADGIWLDSEVDKHKLKAQPAELVFLSATQARLTLTEGKYHQVKRMFAALDNHVTQLHRAKIGALTLDGLDIGECRCLTQDEIQLF